MALPVIQDIVLVSGSLASGQADFRVIATGGSVDGLTLVGVVTDSAMQNSAEVTVVLDGSATTVVDSEVTADRGTITQDSTDPLLWRWVA